MNIYDYAVSKGPVRIPKQLAGCTNLSAEEGMLLYGILYKILGKK